MARLRPGEVQCHACGKVQDGLAKVRESDPRCAACRKPLLEVLQMQRREEVEREAREGTK